MLFKITNYDQLDTAALMAVYAGSNLENAEEMFPELEREAGVRKVEEGFLDFLKNDFFAKDNNTYFVLEEGGEWFAALRISELPDRLFYLEALETRPDARRRGYAAKLINAVIAELSKGGPFRLRDCVDKMNIPSVKTHEKSGFSITGDGYDFLSGETKDWEYSMEYRWSGGKP